MDIWNGEGSDAIIRTTYHDAKGSCRTKSVVKPSKIPGTESKKVKYMDARAFWTRLFRRTRTRTQTEVRNLDSDLRNRDFPIP
jgi:hypothetical protein